MYAIIKTGGKQYKVSENELVKIERLPLAVGAAVEFDDVLMIADGENIKIGTPYLPSIKVIGEVVNLGRGEKVHIIKFRRRKHFMKRAGHRQNFMTVKIKSIGK